MRSIRLLPVVVVAASTLLVFKSVGLVTNGGYVLSGVSTAQAQQEAPQLSTEEAVAAQDAADALFSSVPEGDDAQTSVNERRNSGTIPFQGGDASSEGVILERLAERRAEIEALSRELELRMAVVEAAELRLEERAAELAAVEARINALVDTRKALEDEQFAALVSMYEGMKPADAATIFNRLDIDILLRVGQAMNPRRLGPIMARMQPERAEQLTVRMARVEAEIDTSLADPDFSSLPQIIGQ